MYGEHPDPLPVAVKRMGKYIILTQTTLREQPDVLMLDDKMASALVEQLKALVNDTK